MKLSIILISMLLMGSLVSAAPRTYKKKHRKYKKASWRETNDVLDYNNDVEEKFSVPPVALSTVSIIN